MRFYTLNGFDSLITKYKSISKPAKASLWFAICNILQKGIQFIVVPIYVRLMTTEQYGEYTIFFSWRELIMIFATLKLFNYVFNNGMVKFSEDKEGYIGSLVGISRVCTLLCLLVYALIYYFVGNLIGIKFSLVLCMLVEFIFLPSYEFWRDRLRFDYDYRPVVLNSVALSVLTPVLGICFIVLSREKGQAAIISKLVASIAVYTGPFIIINKNRGPLYNKKYWKYILTFSLPLIPHFLSGMILLQSDRIMIGYFKGNSDAGIYGLAYSLAMAMLIFNDAILTSYNPYCYKIIKKGKMNELTKTTNSTIWIIAIIDILVMFVAREAIEVIGTRDYYAASYVIPAVSASVFFMFLFNNFVVIEYYFEKTKEVAYATMIGAAVNILLNYILLQRYSFVAAGYTTLIGYLIMALMHFIFMKRILKSRHEANMPCEMKTIISTSVLVLASVIISTTLMKYRLIRYFVVLGILVFAFLKRRILMNGILNMRDD